MKNASVKCWLFLLSVVLCLGFARTESALGAADCPVTFPPPVGNVLTSDIVQYPNYPSSDATFDITVTNNNQPLPEGTYLGWCVDANTDISVSQIATLPSSVIGPLYPDCDANLNSQLPTNHPASCYVSPAVWQEVNYLLNHKTGVYFWTVQEAINELVGGPPLTGPDYPPFDTNGVDTLVSNAVTYAAAWTPTNGNVEGVVYVITNEQSTALTVPIQLIVIEVPIACPCPLKTLDCPPDVTIYTNIIITTNCCVKTYCTFDCSDWAGPCNDNNNNHTGYGQCGAYSWWTSNCNTNGNNNWNNNWSGCWSSFCSSWTNFWVNCCSNQYQCNNNNQGNNNGYGNNGYGNNGYGNNNNCGVNWNNVVFSMTNCWGIWNQNNLSLCQWLPCGGNNPGSILTNCYNTVYSNGCVTIGLPTNGYCLKFTSCNAVRNFLTNTCAPGTLKCNYTNANTCSAGEFACKVLALQLNCDISDCDKNSGGCIGQFGDHYLNDCDSPCDGLKVRDILCVANTCLGGGDVSGYGCNVSNLCTVLDNLNCAFKGCQPSSYCTNHISVTPSAPPPCVTGFATATNECGQFLPVTYSNMLFSITGSNTYIFYRIWQACDTCGNCTTCTQTITLTPPPCTVCISGMVGRDCNDNGTYDGSNPGIAGIPVTLKNGSNIVETATTYANGDYTFTNVMPGTYIVTVKPGTNYTQTYPSGNSGITVTVTNCQNVSGVNFALMGTSKCLSVTWSCPSSSKCGNTVTYTCTVQNTGTCCFTGGCKLSCPCFGGWNQTCTTPIYPGQSCSFTKSYTYQNHDCGNFNCNATCNGYAFDGSYCSGQGYCSTQVSNH
jgi:hypothetical protein